MSSPTMKQASDALWWVSQDPNSRQLAEARELAERAYRHTMACAHEEGRAEGEARGRAESEARGRAEGEARGRAEGEARGRAKDILAILEARGIDTREAQRQRVV